MTAADEPTALATAAADALTGETRVPDTWIADQLTTDDLPGSQDVIWFEGDAVLDGHHRGA